MNIISKKEKKKKLQDNLRVAYSYIKNKLLSF